jgi:hypothetical protein
MLDGGFSDAFHFLLCAFLIFSKCSTVNTSYFCNISSFLEKKKEKVDKFSLTKLKY